MSQTYSADFKRQATGLATQPDHSVDEIARDLGIGRSTLSNWIRMARDHGELAFPGKGKARLTPEQEELKRLRKENELLRQERDILKSGGGLVRETQQVKFAFIQEQSPAFPVRALCRVLQVSESGYYSWKTRPPKRKLNDQQMLVEIHEIHQHSKGRYGAPRVHAALRIKGIHASKRRVARLMRVAGLRGKGRRKYKKTTQSNHALPVAQNLVNREFKVAEPNTVWGADLTYIPTREGWLYLSVVLDFHSRMVVGWAMGNRMTTDLPLAALNMAAQRRSPPGGLIHHSDRGSQFASHAYQRQLWSLGMLCSMSSKGDCYDNAVVEGFFATLKRELIAGRVWNTRPEAEQEIFAFLEIFYNRQRLHSTLGYLSPQQFENRQLAKEGRVA
ncbi:IS3 family transposase [Deinococcus fonticola]|uniref:IS3 family transposase n=1 Tax=Deinococcus fonticola TaxID=2528713 RepID=UPI001F111C5A|nr:IS3 family transposase [Deinococcus fonticola]